MKLLCQPLASFQRLLDHRLKHLSQKVQEGVKTSGEHLKQELRTEVVRSGLGLRLSRTWTAKFYKNGEMEAATLVYSKAPRLIRAFSENTHIQIRHAQWLALPTAHAPHRGIGGAKISPQTFPVSRLGPLVFVQKTEQLALLLVPPLKPTKAGFKKASRGERMKRSALTSVVMFILLKETRLQKRLDPPRLLRRNVKRLIRALETS